MLEQMRSEQLLHLETGINPVAFPTKSRGDILCTFTARSIITSLMLRGEVPGRLWGGPSMVFWTTVRVLMVFWTLYVALMDAVTPTM